VERIYIRTPSLKASQTAPLKIVHLTDIHFDDQLPARISPQLLDQVVQVTNAEQPDLILLTGDFVQRRAAPITFLAENWLSKLKARYGVYGVLGNHDYREVGGAEHIIQTLEEHGIRLLRSESIHPIPNDRSIELVGVGDQHQRSEYLPSVSFSKINPSEDSTTTRIVLSHNPDSAPDFTKWKVDLQLSGHLHGGQVCFPWSRIPVWQIFHYMFTYIPLLRRIFKKAKPKNWEQASGLHQIPRPNDTNASPNLLYVSRGLATHPPLRLFCPPEVAVIYLSKE